AAPPSTYKTDVDAYRLYESVLGELGALPGVQSVGATSWLPLAEAGHDNGAIWVEDHPTPAGSVPNVHDQVFADRRYLAAMHIPLFAGRAFGSVDPTRPPHEVLVTRGFAERYWKNGSAIGKRIHPGPSDEWSTIVGVVGDVRIEGLDQAPAQAVYFPLLMKQDSVLYAPRVVTFVVRAAGDPGTLTGAVRRVMQRLAAAAPMF